MKKVLSFLAAFVLLGSFASSAWAYDGSVTLDGGQTIYYEYNSSSQTITITCPDIIYGGFWDGYTKPTGALVIPNSITHNGVQRSVTSIQDYAFFQCTGLTSVSIPSSVTSIGQDAFLGCSGLTSITIPTSVTYIGLTAFSGCTSLISVIYTGTIAQWCNITFVSGFDNPYSLIISGSPVTNLVIPNSVTSIDDRFTNCTSLTSVTIPSSVNEIAPSAFKGCSSLASVTIPSSVTLIDYYAFYGCTSLTSVTIPNSVTSIGSHAFSGCSGLTSVTIGSGVTWIGSYAFDGCSSLTSVTIPNSVTSIANSAFSGCTGLTSVIFNADSCISAGNSSSPIFNGCSNLTNITFGNNVKRIPSYLCKGTNIDYANLSLSSFTKMTSSTTAPAGNNYFRYVVTTSITNGSQNYCYYTFKSADGSMVWNFTPRCTGGNAMGYGNGNLSSNNSNLFTNTTIGNTITYSNLGGVKITYTNLGWLIEFPVEVHCTQRQNNAAYSSVYWGTYATLNSGSGNSGSSITSVTIPNSVTSIGEFAFGDCTNLDTLIVGSGLTVIDNNAFSNVNIKVLSYNCPANLPANINKSQLISVTIGESVTSIGNSAFEGSTSLTSITIPSSITSIGESAFLNCTGLTSVSIGNSVTSIGESAFEACTNLTSITIPNSVTSIGNSAFGDCTNLDTLIIGTGLTTIDDAFSDINIKILSYNCPANIPLYIDNSQLISVTIGESVTSIGNSAFEGSSNLTSVTIGNGVTEIGSSAFKNCTSLTSVTIPDNVTSIGDNTFYGCSSLTSITIPNSVTSIGNYAFYGCSSLTSITIPSSVTSIGQSAFSSCSGLTSVTIPSSITSIGKNAFSNCTGLDTVWMMPLTPPSLGSSAFNNNASVRVFILNGCTYNNYYTTTSSNPWYTYRNYLRHPIIDINVTVQPSDSTRGTAAVVLGPSNRIVRCDSTVVVHATANTGYHFDHWSTGCTANSDTVNLMGDSTVTAYFIALTPTSDSTRGIASHTKIGDHMEQIIATANYGYHFDHWSNGSTSNPDTITLVGDSTVTAYFIALTPTSDSTRGIASHTKIGDHMEQIIATPNYGYHFDHWSNGSTANPDTITLVGDSTVNAYFEKNQYAVVAASGEVFNTDFEEAGNNGFTIINGSYTNQWYIDSLEGNRALFISNDGGQSNSYTNTATSYVYAYKFVYLTADSLYYSYDWRCNGESNYDYLRVALLPDSISVNASGWGTTSLPSGAIALDGGSQLRGQSTWQTFSDTINIPTAGYYNLVFRWKNDFSEGTNPPAAVDNITLHQTIDAADFPGVVTGSDTVPYLDTVTLTATANDHYHFDHWSDGDTNNPRQVVATDDTVLIAVFGLDIHLLSLASDDTVRGSVGFSTSATSGSNSDTLEAGYMTNNIIVAYANYGYHFDHWSNGSTNNPDTITLVGDSSLTAYFEINHYAIVGEVNDTLFGSVTGSDTVPYLDTVTLTATANYGYHFVQWSDGDTNNTRQVVATDNMVLVAMFALNQYEFAIATDDTAMGNVSYYDTLTINTIGDYSHLSLANFTQMTSSTTAPAGDNYFRYVVTTSITNGSQSYCYYTFKSADGSMVWNFTPRCTGGNAMGYGNGNLSSNNSNLFTNTTIGNTITYSNLGGVKITYSNIGWVIEFPVEVHCTQRESNASYTTVYWGNPIYSENIAADTIVADYMSTFIISAQEKYGYRFTQWSNGSTANPDTVTLVSDTSIIAIFEPRPLHYVEVGPADSTRGVAFILNNTLTGIDTIHYSNLDINDFNLMTGSSSSPAGDTSFMAILIPEVEGHSDYNNNSYYIFESWDGKRRWAVSTYSSGPYAIMCQNVEQSSSYYYNNYNNIFIDTTIGHQYFYSRNIQCITVTRSNLGWIVDFPVEVHCTSRGSQANTNVYWHAEGLNHDFRSRGSAHEYYYWIEAIPRAGYHFGHWSNGSRDIIDTLLLTSDSILDAYFYRLDVDMNNSLRGSVAHTKLAERVEKITAQANYGYHFDHWSNGSTANPDTVTLVGDSIITAYFLPNQYTITGTSANTARGTITGSATVDYLDTVTLIAHPNYGYHLDHWTYTNEYNDNTITQNGGDTLTLVANKDRSATAYFNPNQYQLTVNVDNSTHGSVSGGGTYNYNTSHTITATASYGYHFDHWSNGSTANPANITLTCDSTVTAYFERNSYDLTVNVNDASLGTVTTPDGTSALYGDTLTAVATPNEHYHVASWQGQGIVATSADKDTVWVRMNSDRTLTCNFAIDTHTVAVTSNDIARGSVSATGTEFAYGSPCTVSATAYTGYTFQSWSNGVTANPYTFAVLEDVELTAIFVLPGEETYTVSVSVNDPAMGTATVNGNATATVTGGTEVTLSATANSGYRFVKWNDDNTQATRTVTVNSNMSFTAIFESVDGIEDVEADGIRIYSADGRIVVEGTDMEVRIYDMMGRQIFNSESRNSKFETQSSQLPAGVYLVKVGTLPARKVVVVR